MIDIFLTISICLAFAALVCVVIAREKCAVKSVEPDKDKTVTKPAEEEFSVPADLSALLGRHIADDCLTVSLTAGPTSKLGRRELLRLKPGTPLRLDRSDFAGIERVMVYSGGMLIGELLLTDAECVAQVMGGSKILGTYVAENNSDESGKVDLRIAIFHRPEGGAVYENGMCRNALSRAIASPYKITLDLLDHTVIFQN